MASPRYLTKSRFKLALECPAKLYFTGKKDTYYDSKLDNQFLQALAEGGFQVGELAKRYYPGGTEIESLDYDTALEQTGKLLMQERVVLYEGAFKHGDLFIRADIVLKKGNNIHLIEVKAKSFDSSKDQFFSKTDGRITGKWQPYLYDIAFQKHVIQKAYSDFSVQASLLLADKTQTASVEGLNQFFFISEADGRYRCRYNGPEDAAELGNRLLITVPVDTEIAWIYNNTDRLSFEEMVKRYAASYKLDKKIEPQLGKQCSKCEFKTNQSAALTTLKSGFEECWLTTGLTASQCSQPLVVDLWNFLKKDACINQGVYLLKDLTREMIEPKTTKKKKEQVPGLSRIDRQEIQIIKVRNRDTSHFLDIEGLKAEMDTWQFPLHFIDFETSMVAIPFNAGRRPYEQIAFQFSHHIVEADGSVRHQGQWISTATGQFPNFDFMRALKKELETDQGTIFRYADHENTIVNAIYQQLAQSQVSDRLELCAWIRTISKSSGSSAEKWCGARCMVDLKEMVMRYYYNPLMGGSNSIKQVLPAILATSGFLKAKYGKPVYGTEIPSKNFTEQAWISFDTNGNLTNPYKLLPPVYESIPNEILDDLLDDDSEIAEGGAAMIAFAKMQFTEMTEVERERIKKALLRYCELDTLAMVMIYEAWKDWCK